MADIKLYYFEGRGRAECVRMMLNEAGLKYENVIVTPESFEELKKDLPFEHLPMLSVDDFQVCEATAIMEHIAVLADRSHCGRKTSYLGRNSVERTISRSIARAAVDLRTDLWNEFIGWPNEETKNQEGFLTKTLPKWLAMLNRLADPTEADGMTPVDEGGDLGLGPGVDFTFGDVAMFDALNQVITHLDEPDILHPYQDLKTWYWRVAERPRMVKYLADRDAQES